MCCDVLWDYILSCRVDYNDSAAASPEPGHPSAKRANHQANPVGARAVGHAENPKGDLRYPPRRRE